MIKWYWKKGIEMRVQLDMLHIKYIHRYRYIDTFFWPNQSAARVGLPKSVHKYKKYLDRVLSYVVVTILGKEAKKLQQCN